MNNAIYLMRKGITNSVNNCVCVKRNLQMIETKHDSCDA